MTRTTKKPSALFVCSKNGGKSQLAAGLMNQLANGTVTVHSAGLMNQLANGTVTVHSAGPNPARR
ncbi:Arsenate-mycothiol transferase ArsC2 [Arthrobacter sp. SO3]|nr:Arsenate-mycothiol transferase ArsC2 [Arthrobacter sp. SO3]